MRAVNTETGLNVEFSARALTPVDADDLRDIRLESLRHYGAIFDNFHAQESLKPASYWEQQTTPTPHHCFFGLFFNDELVGVMAARRWEKDPTGKTALWWGNYTKPDFRGLRATKALYQKRIDWSRRQGMVRAMAYVLDGTERPASILRKIGSKIIRSEEMRFADGPPALWHWHEVPLMLNP